MNTMKHTFSTFSRKDVFLFHENKKGMLRQLIDDLNDIEELGEKIGQAILQSFKNGSPIKGLYLYGHAGRAKEILLESIIRSFDNAENLAFKWQERKKIQTFNCWPEVRLIPNDIFEQMLKEKHPLKSEEILIVRWTGHSVEDTMESNRIELELLVAESENEAKTQKTISFEPPSGDFHTFASLAGTGNGIEIVESLKS